MKEEEFLVITPEKSPEEKTKWTIETDLFYLFECKHCQIVTMVEEEAAHFENSKHPSEIVLKCPVCHTENPIPKDQNRLKLKLDRIMKPDETNPWYNEIIERTAKNELTEDNTPSASRTGVSFG